MEVMRIGGSAVSQVGVCRAEKELSALHAALGRPHLVQGVAANQHRRPHGQLCLCILTEYVHVLHLLMLQTDSVFSHHGAYSFMNLGVASNKPWQEMRW